MISSSSWNPAARSSSTHRTGVLFHTVIGVIPAMAIECVVFADCGSDTVPDEFRRSSIVAFKNGDYELTFKEAQLLLTHEPTSSSTIVILPESAESRTDSDSGEGSESGAAYFRELPFSH